MNQNTNEVGKLPETHVGGFKIGQRVFVTDAAPYTDGWYVLHRAETVSGQIETPDTIVTLCPPDNAPGDYIRVMASQLDESAPVVVAGQLRSVNEANIAEAEADGFHITEGTAGQDEDKRMDARITFSAQGSITQTVTIHDPDYTPERLVKDLNSGKLVTTVQENGTIDVTASGKVVANVVNVDNELEYSEFELRT